MNTRTKRFLAMALTLCMLLSMCPVTARADSYSVGDTVTIWAGSAEQALNPLKYPTPEDVENGVWVIDLSKITTCDFALKQEHKHTDACTGLICDHKNGHFTTCYDTKTTYAVCPDANTHAHDGHVNIAEVVSYREIKETNKWTGRETTVGLEINWDTAHPAYSVIHEYYAIDCKGSDDQNYDSLSDLGRLATDIWAIAQTMQKTFCFTAPSDEPICGHVCSEAHYGLICGFDYEHTHVYTDGGCYSFTYVLKPDRNNNNVEDGSYGDPYCTVTYVDDNGTELKKYENLLTSDTIPAPPADPSKAANAQYTYTFAGWDPVPDTGANVSGDATYTATYNSTVNKYTVTWVDEDGTELEKDEGVEYGTKPTFDRENPSKPAVGNTKYFFAGWLPAIADDTIVTGDVTYTATYTDETTWTVTFDANGGTAVAEVYVIEGRAVEAPTVSRENYTLDGWYIGEEKYDFAKPVESDLKLKAVWVPVNDSNADGIADEEQGNTVQVNAQNASAAINGEAASNATVGMNEAVTVVITPAEGYAVTSVSLVTSDAVSAIAEGENETALEITYVENRAASVSFTAGFEKVYTLNVVTVKADLVLKGDHEAKLNRFAPMDEPTVFNAVYESSVPALTIDSCTVEYLAFSANLPLVGQVDWWVKPGTDVSLDTFLAKYNLTATANVIKNYLAENNIALPHGFGEQDTESVRVRYEGDQIYPALEATTIVDIYDARTTTEITLNENVSLTWSESLTAEDIYDALDAKLLAEGSEIDGELTYSITGINAGEQTVTVKFAGDNTYASSTASATVTIRKAVPSVSVDSASVKYGTDVNVGQLIDTGSAARIEVAAGLSLGANAGHDAGPIVYINLPNLIDISALPQQWQSIAQWLLDEIQSQRTIQLSELSTVLKGFVDLARQNGLEDYLNLNLDSINALIGLLDNLSGVEGLSEITVKLTFGSTITLSDSGTYLVGTVVSDANYETGYGMNYVVITPDGAKLELDWNEGDDNGVYTLEAVRSGSHDLGASIVTVYEQIDGVDPADHLEVIFLGADVDNGATAITDVNDLTIGTYTQIAYIRDLGNQMYYAEPIVRQVTIISDVVTVTFEDSNENNARIFPNDGKPHAMQAIASHRDGIALDQNNLTYQIYGMESDGDLYNATFTHTQILSGNVGPVNTGVYTVVATYREDEAAGHPEYVGIGIGTMVIEAKTAEISVSDLVRPYSDSEATSLSSLITSSPADAKTVIMVAGISDIGDFSEQGLAAVEGTVLVDFPARVDNALAELSGKTTFTTEELKTVLGAVASALEVTGLDVSYISDFLDQLAQLPGEVTVEITDLSGYSFQKIGAWVVVGGIMDNDYYPAADVGLVVIHPELDSYTLHWNYDDANGIISRTALESVDLLARAENADGETVEANILYYVAGVTEDGETVEFYGSAADIEDQLKALPNGIYTEFAYLYTQMDATMVAAQPIARSLVLVSQTAVVDAPEKTYTYGDTIDYASCVTVTPNDGTAADMDALRITYVGIDGTSGAYSGAEVPTNAGIYAAYATYVVYDTNGSVKYLGADIGTITIQPARLNYDVKDSVETFDGEPKAPVIENPENASDILFIVDTQEGTVNIVAPSLGKDQDPTVNWDGDIHIQYWLDQLEQLLQQNGTTPEQLITELEKLLGELEAITGVNILGSDTYQDLKRVLTTIDSDLVYLNAKLPTGEDGKVCKYTVYALAYKDGNHVAEISEGSITIGSGKPIYFDLNDSKIEAGDTVYINDEAYILDENGIVWVDSTELKLAVSYVYKLSGDHTTAYSFADNSDMYFWQLTYHGDRYCYTAQRIEALDNALKFAGASIWLSSDGANGIRVHYNAVSTSAENALSAMGYKLVNYGCVMNWVSTLENAGQELPTLRADGTNFATGRYSEEFGSYYVTAAPLRDEYIVPSLRARFFLQLQTEDGQIVTIYSGVIQRSIGYVAWQNRDVFNGSVYDTYIQRILDHALANGAKYE